MHRNDRYQKANYNIPQIGPLRRPLRRPLHRLHRPAFPLQRWIVLPRDPHHRDQRFRWIQQRLSFHRPPEPRYIAQIHLVRRQAAVSVEVPGNNN